MEYKIATLEEYTASSPFNKKYVRSTTFVFPLALKSCLAGVEVSLVNTLNVYDILNADKFIVSQAAVKGIEEVFA